MKWSFQKDDETMGFQKKKKPSNDQEFEEFCFDCSSRIISGSGLESPEPFNIDNERPIQYICSLVMGLIKMSGSHFETKRTNAN